MRSLSSHGKNRGVVLVIVLWLIVILSLMAYSLLFQVSSEVTVTSTRKKQLQAEFLARAGLSKAIIDLKNDLLFDVSSEENKAFDAEGDVWARPEEGKEEVYLTRDEEEGYYDVRVYDEESLINLKIMSQSNLKVLQNILVHFGYDEKDAEIAAAAIVDWQDPDLIPAYPNANAEEEGIFYSILRGEDTGGETDPDDASPIPMRNENFLTTDELLEVYGVTPEAYFGYETPEAEYFKEEMNIDYGGRFELDPPRRSRLDDGPPPALRDIFTVYGTGILNMNTAPVYVLEAYAAGAGHSDPGSFADRVIRTRRGSKETNIDNSSAFKDRAALQSNTEISGVVAMGNNSIPTDVRSTTFRIVSEGHVGDVKVRIEALVFRKLLRLNRNEDFEYMERAEERRDVNSARYERRENRDNENQILYPYVRIIQMQIE